MVFQISTKTIPVKYHHCVVLRRRASALYAQMGAKTQSALLEGAADVPLDTIRGHTLLASGGGAAASVPTAAEAACQRRAAELHYFCTDPDN